MLRYRLGKAVEVGCCENVPVCTLQSALGTCSTGAPRRPPPRRIRHCCELPQALVNGSLHCAVCLQGGADGSIRSHLLHHAAHAANQNASKQGLLAVPMGASKLRPRKLR